MPTKEEARLFAKIPIKECGEPFVNGKKYDKRIVVDIEATSRRFQKLPKGTFYLRRGAAKRLAQAQHYLPTGLRLKVCDGFRPLNAQRKLYSNYLRKAMRENSKFTRKQAEEFTDRWVANPDKVVPPHTTGGTIDLTIVDTRGRELDMGAPVNFVGAKGRTQARGLSKIAVKNRKMPLGQALS